MHMLKNLELKKDAERIKELESVVFSEETNNESLEQWKVLQNPDKLVENLTSLVSTLKTIKNKKSEVLSKKKLDEQNTLKSIQNNDRLAVMRQDLVAQKEKSDEEMKFVKSL